MQNFSTIKALIVVLLSLIMTPEMALAAIKYTITGDVAFDKRSIYVEATLTGVPKSDLKPGGSITDYKENLRVYLTAVSSDTPLRTNVGSDEKEDLINDFYWDKVEAGVTRESETSTEYNLKYSFYIYENKSFLDYDRIDSLLDSSSPEKLKVEIAFFAYKSDGTYEKVTQSAEFEIAVNYAAVNDDISLGSVSQINKGIRVSWDPVEKVDFTDSRPRNTPEVLVTVFEVTAGDIDLSSASYLADTTGTPGDNKSGSCLIDMSLVDEQTSCVSNCTNDASEIIYLKGDEMAKLETSGHLVYSSLLPNTQSSVDISGLKVGGSYAVFIQYKRGNKRSLCLSSIVRENRTLLEENGEADAKLKEQNCFIATAAFGSPLNKHVDTFRWFRNHYLLTNGLGNSFVNLYYMHSPKYAEIIKSNPTLKALTMMSLYPFYLGIKSLEIFGLPLTILFLLSISLGFWYLSRFFRVKYVS